MTVQLSSIQILTCCRAPNFIGSKWSLACQDYPDTSTGTPEDVFYLLAIKGPTRSEGKPGIEPGSSDPQLSPLPLRHRVGLDYLLLARQNTNVLLLNLCRLTYEKTKTFFHI